MPRQTRETNKYLFCGQKSETFFRKGLAIWKRIQYNDSEMEVEWSQSG